LPIISKTAFRGELMIAIQNVMVATDFGEAANAALRYGRALAGRFGATLHVVHIVEPSFAGFGVETYVPLLPDVDGALEESARRRLNSLIESAGNGPRTLATALPSSVPPVAIIDYARDHDIDLIVMGTHGRGGLAHLVMGSVAERVVREAPCPVLTMKQSERAIAMAEIPLIIRAAAPVMS
jgi:nucleotide-binding universal stress UspA family protein